MAELNEQITSARNKLIDLHNKYQEELREVVVKIDKYLEGISK